MKSFLRIRSIAIPFPITIEGGVPKRNATYRFEAILPSTNFCFQQINDIPILQTPLAQQLIQISSSPNEIFGYSLISSRRSGFVTLSSLRQIIPLLETDPEISYIPVVGIWVYIDVALMAGEEKNSSGKLIGNPIVWTSCVRYFQSQFLQEKVWIKPNTFLLVGLCI